MILFSSITADRPETEPLYSKSSFFNWHFTTVSINLPNFAGYLMEKKKSIFQRAAEWGIPFGLYLAAAAMTYIFSDYFPPLSLLFMVMCAFTPVVVYFFQRRKFIEDDGFTEYAGLWMLGIMLFLLGSVIASLIIYLVLQYVRPTFMYDQAQVIIDAYKDVPDMKDSDLLLVIKRMVDKKLMPSPIEVVMNMYWLTTFLGSLTSAFTALIAHRTINRRRKQS